MSFRRAVASNLVVQALGPASSFLTVLVIARLGGPADQGRFAQLKAFVDLTAALGCFGFPQAFIYVIHRLGASAPVLARWSAAYAAAFLPVALAASALALWLGYLGGAGGSSLGPVLVVGTAGALLVLQGLWRGVFLTRSTGAPFAVFTILPAVALLFAVVAAMLAGSRRFDWVILASAVGTVLAAGAMMAPVLRSPGGSRLRDQPWAALVSNGVHAFLQAVLATLQPVVAYGLVRLHGGQAHDAGLLNVGLFLVQGLTVPISMVAPLLFARWTSLADDGLVGRLRELTARGLGLGLAAGAIGALAAAAVVPLVFGEAYGAATRPAQAMLLTLPLAWHVRIVAPALHARGQPGINTAAAALRLGAFAISALALARLLPDVLLATGLAWSFGEAASAAWTLVGLRLVAARAGARAQAGCA